MSPSEVIIEVYIMPEDAPPGASFFFQFKDPFLVSQGWRGKSSNLILCQQQAWLHCLAPLCSPLGEQEEAGSGVSISNRFLFATPRAPFTTGVLSAKASPSHPKPGPKGFPFSLLMDEGII